MALVHGVVASCLDNEPQLGRVPCLWRAWCMEATVDVNGVWRPLVSIRNVRPLFVRIALADNFAGLLKD